MCIGHFYYLAQRTTNAFSHNWLGSVAIIKSPNRHAGPHLIF